MRVAGWLGVVWLLVGLLIAPVAAGEKDLTDYRIGPGDGLVIKVEEEPDMTLDAKVSTQGTIQFVLLGELQVAGMTAGELRHTLEERLADGYLRNPRVNIVIKEYRLFFVQGEVKTPGGYPFQPEVTVRKAIVLAGGFTDVANKDRVTIIRGSDKSFHEKSVELDEPVLPGDVVTVQESFW